MRIEDVSFGNVTIEGEVYTKDVIVFKDCVRGNWWRREGHSLAREDLPEVFERRPQVFVMGCGQHGELKIPAGTRQAFEAAGILLSAMKTPEACEELNRLFEEGADAAGGLHLTC